jgi:hypothetical protein
MKFRLDKDYQRYIRYALWLLKKDFQIFIRTGLSHWLAVLLAILVLTRESHELAAILGFYLPVPSIWLVIVVTAGTLFVAIWEVFGNKLKISRQEVHFLYTMRTLQEELEKLLYAQDDDQHPNVRLKEFLGGALNMISETFSVRSKSDVGLMVKLQNSRNLKLVMCSKNARYPENLEIPIPPDSGEIENVDSTGPAGVAYSRTTTVYVPRIRREVWPFKRKHNEKRDWYQSSVPVICWISAPSPQLENFRSVLCVPICVPIAANQSKTDYNKLGVLNVSTTLHDPYVSRDFMMAECFASLLATAIAGTKIRVKAGF